MLGLTIIGCETLCLLLRFMKAKNFQKFFFTPEFVKHFAVLEDEPNQLHEDEASAKGPL